MTVPTSNITTVPPILNLGALGRRLFSRGKPIYIARAPGRLDVMGGIADYSGSLVLEMPIAETTIVAVQECDEPYVEVVSVAETAGVKARRVALDADAWKALKQADSEAARQRLAADP